MKKFFVFCLTFLCLTSCFESSVDSAPGINRFEVVSQQSLYGSTRIIYVIRDTQTGCEYLSISSPYGQSVCPLNH